MNRCPLRVRQVQITLLVIVLLLRVVPASAAATESTSVPQISLTELLADRFGNLSQAEKRLAAKTEIGETADCTDLSGGDKIIRGEVFAWLCTNPQATAQVTYLGISVTGAVLASIVDLRWAKIQFPLRATNCRFTDDLILDGASIRGLVLEGSHLKGLHADEITVEQDMVLSNEFRSEGSVSLEKATIGGDLRCVGGNFCGTDYRENYAVFAPEARIAGSVDLRSATARGGVQLRAAKIGASLICSGASLKNTTANRKRVVAIFPRHQQPPESMNRRIVLDARGANIEGSVYLDKCFEADGTLSFAGSEIKHLFAWRDVISPERVILDLRNAKAGVLDNEKPWPSTEHLALHGFVFDELDSGSTGLILEGEIQKSWIALQPGGRFLSQPYQQMAEVLRRMGLEEDARAVMIAKNEEHARYVQGQPEWLWYGLFGHLIGYGYSPWRGFAISLGVILLGWAVFRRGYYRGLITPIGETKYNIVNHEAQPVSKDYPKFNAFVYSLETFVPLVKLGMTDRWEPNGNRDAYFVERSWLMTGGCLRGYLWFHMTAGWVLSALWVGALTGLIKT
jgi:hypothetical protein